MVRKRASKQIVKRATAAPSQHEFDPVLALIDAFRTRAIAAVNTELIDLYWSIGEHIAKKISDGFIRYTRRGRDAFRDYFLMNRAVNSSRTFSHGIPSPRSA